MSDINFLRTELAEYEDMYARYIDMKVYNLADAVWFEIQKLQNMILSIITAEDPNTTEADVRYFEGWNY